MTGGTLGSTSEHVNCLRGFEESNHGHLHVGHFYSRHEHLDGLAPRHCLQRHSGGGYYRRAAKSPAAIENGKVNIAIMSSMPPAVTVSVTTVADRACSIIIRHPATTARSTGTKAPPTKPISQELIVGSEFFSFEHITRARRMATPMLIMK